MQLNRMRSPIHCGSNSRLSSRMIRSCWEQNTTRRRLSLMAFCADSGCVARAWPNPAPWRSICLSIQVPGSMPSHVHLGMRGGLKASAFASPGPYSKAHQELCRQSWLIIVRDLDAKQRQFSRTTRQTIERGISDTRTS